jgi:cation diffusion facilitator CzcD-associated flavoprotein CzcO
MSQPDHQVVVIGGGFSGIGATILLEKAGFDDVLVLEMGEDIGGAWFHNTYPGVAVDTPSFGYSFSFEQNPSWSRVFAPGKELKAYADHCVDRYGIRRKIRLRAKVVAADFDEARNWWRLQLEGGEVITARFVVAATGVFSKPKSPAIEGLESFEGPTIHTATWDHSVSLTGKRVAVIGTGASAVQVIPAIAPEVAHLSVFQRTAIWILPKTDPEIPPHVQALFARLPATQRVARFAALAASETLLVLAFHYARDLPALRRYLTDTGLQHLERQVKDPELRKRLTPTYDFGCKRPSVSNHYLRAFTRDNVDLVTDPIERITPRGVLTRDGVLHEADVLVLATGFKVFEPDNVPPYPTRGVGGVELGRFWAEHRSQSYQGVSVPGYPNLFSILGPYGWNGTSYFALIETQMRHIVRLLREARKRGATYVDVQARANADYHASMLKRQQRSVWFNADCQTSNSYYFNADGDVAFRPVTSAEAWWRAGHFPLRDYAFEA